MRDYERELTYKEKQKIKKLVSECANYCQEYGCLQLNDACYMLMKCWTGAYCRYFREAVLPLDPELETALLGGGETKTCIICGSEFPAGSKRMYCSSVCASEVQRKRNKEFMRKKRG